MFLELTLEEQLESSQEEVKDLRAMLEVRGVLPPEDCGEEPVQDRKGPRGGGGRKHIMGMRAPAAKRTRTQVQSGAQAAQESGEGEEPPEQPDLAGPEAAGEEEYPDLADLAEEEQAAE